MPQTFLVQILGVNAALPAHGRHPTSQYLNIGSEHFLIDCGESCQSQLSKYKVPRQKISHIFISHLHGDHIFGLPGLINSFILQGRKSPLNIYSSNGLEPFIDHIFKMANTECPFDLNFIPLDATENVLDTKDVRVRCFPLEHRIPCFGFIFEEKNNSIRLSESALQRYNVPNRERSKISQGYDFVHNDTVIGNEEFIETILHARKYAFCTDTRVVMGNSDFLNGVDLLYHEATFLDELKDKATATFHSTALQAARFAKEADVGHLLLGHYSSRYPDPQVLETEAKKAMTKVHASREGYTYTLCYSDTGDKQLIIKNP